ncbi:uncharacterized protein V1516DRAFT_662683 [Lipomyces oligophaga]|uniref:uncharacterized protein n=1 Tax=Lipomyces oligophaga TaxID=45792 RepID=UPI0034CF58C0
MQTSSLPSTSWALSSTSSSSNLTASGQSLGLVDAALAELTLADAVPDHDFQLRLKRVRNMWQFAALFQWLFFFRHVIKMDDIDVTIEALEKELLGLTPLALIPQIRLSLLQQLSSQRGLTLDQFSDYTRRQYRQKDPFLECPFGDEEEPIPFENLNVYDQIKVLYQLTSWQSLMAERFRERMGNLKESQEVGWRIDSVGKDSNDNVYYLLDDNRLYSRHVPPPSQKSRTLTQAIEEAPEPAEQIARVQTPKPKKKKRRPVTGWTIARKRRRKTSSTTTPQKHEDEDDEEENENGNEGEEDSSLTKVTNGGDHQEDKEVTAKEEDEEADPDESADADQDQEEDKVAKVGIPTSENDDIYDELDEHSSDAETTWKCVCATYTEWQDFFNYIGKRARDRSKKAEKDLHAILKLEIMPVIQSLENERLELEAQKLKEIEKLRLVENRKKSSRADAMAAKKQEEDQRRKEVEFAEQERVRRKIERKQRAQTEKDREIRLQKRDIRLEEQRQRREAQLAKKAALKAEREAAKMAAGESIVTTPVPIAEPAPEPAAKTVARSISPARSERQQSHDSEVHAPTRRSTRQQNQVQQQDQDHAEPATVPNMASRNGAATPASSTWYFDCYCGVHGDNYDDGQLSVCCGKCDIWMHVSHLAPDELRRFESSTRSGEEDKDEQEEKVVADEEDAVSEGEFICNRCIRIEKEKAREAELERKREADRVRRRERERKREQERRRQRQEAKEQAAREEQMRVNAKVQESKPKAPLPPESNSSITVASLPLPQGGAATTVPVPVSVRPAIVSGPVSVPVSTPVSTSLPSQNRPETMGVAGATVGVLTPGPLNLNQIHYANIPNGSTNGQVNGVNPPKGHGGEDGQTGLDILADVTSSFAS